MTYADLADFEASNSTTIRNLTSPVSPSTWKREREGRLRVVLIRRLLHSISMQ